MQLWIPTIGDAILLESEWKFSLWDEHRNHDMSEALGRKFAYRPSWHPDSQAMFEATLPSETELVVDRIYIRQGASDFDSVTFVVKACPKTKLVGERFWAKLDDVNRIQCRHTTRDNPIGHFAKAKYRAELKALTDPDGAAKAADKRTSREKSAQELVKCRNAIMEWVRNAYNGNQHMGFINALASDLRQRINDKHHYGLAYYWGQRQIEDSACWKCISTQHKDGTVIRKFRISYYDIMAGGIELTTHHDGTITFRPFHVKNGAYDFNV